MGVWIEIVIYGVRKLYVGSLPAWECGLKYLQVEAERKEQLVTPCVGVWIEIDQWQDIPQRKKCHSLRGSVN